MRAWNHSVDAPLCAACGIMRPGILFKTGILRHPSRGTVRHYVIAAIQEHTLVGPMHPAIHAQAMRELKFLLATD